jgi:hypothetical protein
VSALVVGRVRRLKLGVVGLWGHRVCLGEK